MNKQETFAKLRLTIPPDVPMLDAALYKIMELEQQLAEAKECLDWAFDLAESHDSYMTSAYKDCDRKWSVRCKDVLK